MSNRYFTWTRNIGDIKTALLV